MYDVVGCSACRELWIRSGEAETATCPRCQQTHQVDRLRVLARAETAEGARDARSHLLAERADLDTTSIAGFAATEPEMDAAGVSDVEYLTEHGIDADAVEDAGERATQTAPSRNRQETVIHAIEDADQPTRDNVLAITAEHGIPDERADAILQKLIDAGDIVRNDGHYRVID